MEPRLHLRFGSRGATPLRLPIGHNCHNPKHQVQQNREPSLRLVTDSLALLWQFGFDGVGDEFLTVRASPGWRPCEEVEDGLPDGRHARLWRRSPDSFFSVPLL